MFTDRDVFDRWSAVHSFVFSDLKQFHIRQRARAESLAVHTAFTFT